MNGCPEETNNAVLQFHCWLKLFYMSLRALKINENPRATQIIPTMIKRAFWEFFKGVEISVSSLKVFL